MASLEEEAKKAWAQQGAMHGTQTNNTYSFDTATEALRPMSREEIIDQLFSYHQPSLMQPPKYEAIRSAAKYFAAVIVQNTPRGADQSAAIRKLREVVMTANAAIALDGLSF